MIQSMKKASLAALVLLAPAIASAQSAANDGGLIPYLEGVVVFINNTLIPFLIVLAFFFFIVNAIRFFIIGGANPQEQEKGKRLMIFGLLALVIIFIFWGVVSLGINVLGFGFSDPVCPDALSGAEGKWCDNAR